MSNNIKLTQYDDLLKDDADVAAIVFRERLRPVQGARGVFFPPTFAPTRKSETSEKSEKSNYQIDRFGPRADDPEGAQKDGVLANRCTVDSVPSQANRLEARLRKYSGTSIPQVTISGSRVGQGSIDLLEVGHRVGDAVVRYSKVKVQNNGKEEEKEEEKDGFELFEAALKAYVKGDAAPLAKLAPTSLVFGHWDSRDSATKKSTKSKARRLIRSEIVAFNVQKVTKRSQYWSSIDPEVSDELKQILKEAKEAAHEDPNTKSPAAQLGMVDHPASESPGGVIAFGPIERTTIIALSGLRALATIGAATDADPSKNNGNDETLALRRYLFALALASAADPGVWDLREGCILVREGKSENGKTVADPTAFTAVKVMHTGAEDTFEPPAIDASKTYLDAAARKFFGDTEFPAAVELTFDPSGAKKAVDAKSGQSTSDPKTKADLIKALVAMPEFAGREAELKRSAYSKDKLVELWRSKAAPSADAARTNDGDASAGSGTSES